MRRTMLVIMALAALTSMAHAEDRLYFGFEIGVANAPAAPRVNLKAEPRLVAVGETRVHVLADPFDWDLFRYGGSWYMYSKGYWYRASVHTGPFRVVDVRVVPTVVLRVPPERWRHHPHGGPPGLNKPRGGQVAAGTSKSQGRGKH